MRETGQTTIAQLRAWAESVGTCPADSVAAMAYHPTGGEIAVAVNGTVNALNNCRDDGCLWVPAGVAGVGRDHARHLHAEASLVAACARVGIKLGGMAVKITRPPCPTCALLLVAAGVRTVVVPPPGDEWEQVIGDMLRAAGVDVVVEVVGGDIRR